MIPRWTPLLKFAHNSAHSCAQDGLHIDNGPNQAGFAGGNDPPSIETYASIDDSGNPRQVTIGADYRPVSNPTALAIANWELYSNLRHVEAVFESFTAWKCRNRAVWTRNSYVTFTHARFADNAIGITFATNGGLGVMKNCIMVGQTPNVGVVSSSQNNSGNYDWIDGVPGTYRTIPKSASYPIRGYEFYDGPNELRNCRFYNFRPSERRNASAISMLRQDQFSIAPTNRAEQVVVDGVTQMLNFQDFVHDGDKASVFIDMDGSITGRPPVGDNKAVVTKRHPFFWTSSCVDPGIGSVQ